MSNYIAGIDPGLNGGIAILNELNLVLVKPMPINITKNGKDIDAKELHKILNCFILEKVAVEIVHSFPGQGVVSTFNFGKGYGKVLAVVEVLGMNLINVSPQHWKKTFDLGHDKKESIAFAMKLFPKEKFMATPRCKKPHDGMAEAVCIAEFVRRRL